MESPSTSLPDDAGGCAPSPPRPVSWGEGLRTYFAIGLRSFGGPAGQIAVMQRILVDEKRWIGQTRFLHALNYCMLLPGPEATQLVTYVGWLMHRTLGGVVAGVLFVLPGFLSILALSLIYWHYSDVRVVQALFFGLKPAILAIVLHAVIRIGSRSLRSKTLVALAAASFIAIFFFGVWFPVIVGAAALLGFVGSRFAPVAFAPALNHRSKGDHPDRGLIDELAEAGQLAHTRPSLFGSLKVLLVCGVLWWAPVAFLALATGPDSVWTTLSVFFSKAAVVTFGGAYAVLAYVQQQAVERFEWVTAAEMMDGLGMAETTPGPLIQVVQHVGFLGAARDSGSLNPSLAGSLAALLVTWVTFAPCFLWIFLGAPYLEALRGKRSLSSALTAVTAAVTGVVLNLAVWFGLHTLFHEVREQQHGPLQLHVPEWSSLDWRSLAISIIACILTFRFNWGVLRVLGVCVALGAAAYMLGT